MRPSVSEYDVCKEFNLLVFKSTKTHWPSFFAFLSKLKTINSSVLNSLVEPEYKYALFLHSISICILVRFSPLFENDLDRRIRLDHWATYSFLNDFADQSITSFENKLSRIQQYQNDFIEAMQSNKNPFQIVTGNFLIDLFGTIDIKHICLPSGDLNPLIHQTLSDVISLNVNAIIPFWKDIYNEYEVIITEIKK